MKCPRELACHLEWSDLVEGRRYAPPHEQLRLWHELAYYETIRELARTRTPRIARRLVQSLVDLAPLVGDPLEVYTFCRSLLDVFECLERNEYSPQLIASARSALAQAIALDAPENVVSLFEALCETLERTVWSERRHAELDATVRNIEARLARFDELDHKEQAQVRRQVYMLDQRTRTLREPPVPVPRLQDRRRPRRPARRATRRVAVRRVQTDAGGGGDDDGPGDAEPPLAPHSGFSVDADAARAR